MAAEEERCNNQANPGHQSPYAGPSLGSPVKLQSEVAGSDRDGPLLRKLRNIHSLELERRLGLECKPSPELFVEAKYVSKSFAVMIEAKVSLDVTNAIICNHPARQNSSMARGTRRWRLTGPPSSQ